MKHIFFIFLLLLSTLSFAQAKIQKSPSWIKIVEIPKFDSDTIFGGTTHLLLDLQYQIERQETFIHIAKRLNGLESVNQNSDIQIQFDPEFEEVVLHSVIVKRKSKYVSKTIDITQDVKQLEYDAENGVNSNIYSGEKIITLQLPDIRKGDVVEYSYTIKGNNALVPYDLFYAHSFQYKFPIQRQYFRVVDKKNRLNYQLKNNAQEPTIIQGNTGGTEYIWNLGFVPECTYPFTVPSWYSPEPQVEFSSFSSYQDVINWALPLYKYQESSIDKIVAQEQFPEDEIDYINAVVEFVQNDVRYLGNEHGISNYKPFSPQQVYEDKFGDCKGKALLLVALLRYKGIEAWPVLVNTEQKEKLSNLLPSPKAFDHCVTIFEFNNQQILIDPTIHSQGGEVQKRYCPNYSLGLIIEEGGEGISQLPVMDQTSEIKLTEVFDLDIVEGKADIVIKTEYIGKKADETRGNIYDNSKSELQEAYLEFYQNYYPNIELKQDFEIIDSQYSDTNKIIVTEYYTLPDYAEKGDGDRIYMDFAPLVLNEYVPQSSDIDNKKEPLALHNRIRFEQTTFVQSNGDLPSESFDYHTQTNSITYDSYVKKKDDYLVINYLYKQYEGIVEGEEIEKFKSTVDNIRNDMAFRLFLDKQTSFLKSGNTNVSAVFFFLGILIIAGFIWFTIHQKLVIRKKIEASNDEQYSFWMIISIVWMVGLAFYQFIFLNNELLNSNFWNQVLSDSSPLGNIGVVLGGIEMLLSGIILSSPIVLIIQFIQKRTSFPILLLSVLILNIILVSIGNAMDSIIFNGYLGNDFILAVISTVVFGIAYFNSEQVPKVFHQERYSKEVFEYDN